MTLLPSVAPGVADVRLSVAARADLVAIDTYGADNFGGAATDAYLLGIEQVLARLGSFPHIGTERPDYGDGIRCLFHRSHRVLYRVDGGMVKVVRVLHRARDVGQAL